MKKIILLFAVASIVLAGLFFYSCEEDVSLEDECKRCKTVEIDSEGNIIREDPYVEYCGDELDEIQLDTVYVLNGDSIKYICE